MCQQLGQLCACGYGQSTLCTVAKMFSSVQEGVQMERVRDRLPIEVSCQYIALLSLMIPFFVPFTAELCCKPYEQWSCTPQEAFS